MRNRNVLRQLPVDDLERAPATIRNAWEAKGRFKPAVGWIMLAFLMLWRPVELAGLPAWVFRLAVAAGACALGHKLLTFGRWKDEGAELPRFAIIFALAVVELFLENFFVWVVAASDERKYDASFVPLQDNAARLVLAAMRSSPVIRALISWHWAHMANLLMAFLCIPFSSLWDQVPYSGFKIAARALLMHVLVRIVRVVCFLAVVMPNSRPSGRVTCYQRRFPPVPDELVDYVWVGMSTLKGFGGCNDLILSGHACTWMMTVMTTWTFYPRGPLKYVVTLAYVQTALRLSVEGWHYSVDFILPAVLCRYIYKELQWVCDEDETLTPRSSKAKDPLSRSAVVVIGFAVAFCVLNAFLVGA